MANVLPRKERLRLRKSYLVRLVLALSIILFAAFFVGTASLLPAYISVRGEYEEAALYRELQDEARAISKNDTAVRTARLVRTQLDVLTASAATPITPMIESAIRDWELYKDDVVISSVSYSAKQDTLSLRISGRARNRATLSAFLQTLRSNPYFSAVHSPVSDLVESDDTTFSIVLERNTDV